MITESPYEGVNGCDCNAQCDSNIRECKSAGVYPLPQWGLERSLLHGATTIDVYIGDHLTA
jgi:hypothetical protein